MKIRRFSLPEDAVQSAYDKDLFVCRNGTLYSFDKKGCYQIVPYLNTNGGSGTWKYGYYKFHYKKKCYFVHLVIAKTFVPGYKKGLVADHINNYSLDNRAENLQWISRGENVKKFWNSLSEEEFKEYKKKYSEGLHQAHLRGSYKKHLEKLHNMEAK